MSPTLISTSPLTDREIARYPLSSDEDVRRAVASARADASWWESLGHAERRRRLTAWRRALARRYDEIVDLIRAETGKTTADARIETLLGLHHLTWAADNAQRVLRRRRVRSGLLMFNHRASVEYRPLGVVGVIGPWNFPLFTPLGSIAYALAAGNAVVFKPSEHTPVVGTFLSESLKPFTSGRNVLRVVHGGADVGAALCASGVQKLAFTGSTATAKKIMAACAPTLTPVLIEAGGKDAMIVDADADLTAAARAAVWGGLANAGQACIGIERVYVHRAVFDSFVDAVRAEMPVRAGRDDDATIGPITTDPQVEVIRTHLVEAVSRGARAIVGSADTGDGNVIQPTVLVDVPDDARVMTEETFGPALTIRPVQSMDEAIALVNGTGFGLGGAVFSRRHGTAVARRLQVGMVSVNAVQAFAAVASLPYGGVGESGFGRIHGDDGLREFAAANSLTVRGWLPSVEMMTFRRPVWVDRLLPAVVRRLFG